jgi:hypothetical protein
MPMHAPSILAQAAQHNPLIPKTFDIVWSVVCVAIITILFWKYVLPRFDTVLAQRAEKIEGGIERAEQIQADAQAALARYTAGLSQARGDAARIRAHARTQGEQILAEARSPRSRNETGSSPPGPADCRRSVRRSWPSCAPNSALSPSLWPGGCWESPCPPMARIRPRWRVFSPS